MRKRASFLVAFPILMHRAFINFIRQQDLVLSRTFTSVGLGIVLTFFMAPLHSDYYSVQTRIGVVQQMGSLYFAGMLQNVAVYPQERDVFYRESDDGVYGVEAFFATYTCVALPAEVISALVYSVLVVLAAGLPRTVEMFFVGAFVCFGVVSCGESLGIMFVSQSRPSQDEGELTAGPTEHPLQPHWLRRQSHQYLSERCADHVGHSEYRHAAAVHSL